jgi:aspartyl-tRNA(Asn)/glutamyl-tRNA(Gln) amidotransferase subunit A
MYRLHVGSDGTGGHGEVERLIGLGVDELRRRFRERRLSPVELIDAVAARIEWAQPLLNAFVTLSLDRAREEAELAERRFATGEERPLEGIPLAVKDLLDTEGIRTTYGSSIFASHVPRADAEAVRRARAAGAIVVGKTATHEFAWGITCDNPHYGPCRNPWDRERISGGSSGGSAAALAAGLVPLALGSDTGGSIRIPAAFCGVTGLKPTYARVSAAGTFPLAPSLDHVGPMAQRPRDAWALYGIIAEIDCTRRGKGDRDRGSESEGGAMRASTGTPGGDGRLSGMRVGICRAPGGVAPSEDVESALDDCLAAAGDLGAAIVDVEPPPAELVEDAFVTTQRAEALETHRERGLFPERGAEYGADVRARLEQATEIGLADYLRSAAGRAGIDAGFSEVFGGVDVLITPVSPVAPVRIGETVSLHRGREVDFRKLVLAATTPQNLAGLPACTLRAGFDSDGLPIGVQVTAPKSHDARAAAVAERLFEATAAVQNRRPELPA